MEEIINNAINKSLNKAKCDSLKEIANNLGIDMGKLKKQDIVQKVKEEIKSKSISQRINILKQSSIPFAIHVKDIINNEIPIDEIIRLGICLNLTELLKSCDLSTKFTNECNLENKDDKIISPGCVDKKVQGLYLLTIRKQDHDVDYIVKIGSFAESQGMKKRIDSFGGGNYETGSATNKWFQAFIKMAIEQGYTAKFTYYLIERQTKITIYDLFDRELEMMPYITRPLETQLFEKYHELNHNISPIFGANCL